MPVLHVVIPFLNEAPTLEAAVNRVLKAPTPKGWGLSIVLVDDGSETPTSLIAKEIAAKNEKITFSLLASYCCAKRKPAVQVAWRDVSLENILLFGSEPDAAVKSMQMSEIPYATLKQHSQSNLLEIDW